MGESAILWLCPAQGVPGQVLGVPSTDVAQLPQKTPHNKLDSGGGEISLPFTYQTPVAESSALSAQLFCGVRVYVRRFGDFMGSGEKIN